MKTGILASLIVLFFIPYMDSALAQSPPMTTLDSLRQPVMWDYVKASDEDVFFMAITSRDMQDLMPAIRSVSLIYLAQTPATTFNTSKVETVKNGRIIVQKGANGKCFNYYIYKLTSDSLILVSLESPAIVSKWKAIR